MAMCPTILWLNAMSSEKRPYALKARAERQQETRRRIVEATHDLHEEVGPARTTVAEIARRAGVQRVTVYAHFPEEAELFAACQGCFLERNPLPDFGRALEQDDPRARVRAVLRGLYAWYRSAEQMVVNVQRDRGALPALDELLTRTNDARLAELAGALAAGFGIDRVGSARVRALLLVAMNLWTWQRLAGDGFDDATAAELMGDAAAAVGERV
jgi:AcrR family transcriptional regulator